MRHKLFLAALLLLLTTLSLRAGAGEIVVIVNVANKQAVDMALVTKIYTGATLSWADGTPIAAFDQSDGIVHTQFAARIGKSSANLKSIWARLMFSGQAIPPAALADDAAVKAAVRQNKAAIGYIDAASVDNTVSVIR
jgi:ABC-type phosphate transport system substrate-binding protein